MALPSRAKKAAESVTALRLAPSAAEAAQASRALRSIADDVEVPLDLRARANQLATDLGAQPSQEDANRREAKTAEASRWASMNI